MREQRSPFLKWSLIAAAVAALTNLVGLIVVPIAAKDPYRAVSAIIAPLVYLFLIGLPTFAGMMLAAFLLQSQHLVSLGQIVISVLTGGVAAALGLTLLLLGALAWMSLVAAPTSEFSILGMFGYLFFAVPVWIIYVGGGMITAVPAMYFIAFQRERSAFPPPTQ